MEQISLRTNRTIPFKTAQNVQTQPEQQVPASSIPDVQIPDLYYTPKSRRKNKGFKETVKQWDMFNIIYPWLTHPFLMLGTCGAMAFGVDKFAEACGGEYNKSLVGRAANLGDKIANSKFTKSSPVQTVLGWGKSALNGIKKVFKNSDLAYAVKNTPSKPEWPMVKDELLTMEQRVVRDFTEITRELRLTEDGGVELDRLNIGKKEKEFFKNFFGETKVSDQVKSNALQLKNLGLEDDAIKSIINSGDATATVKAETLKKLGLTQEKVGMDLKSYFEKLAKGKVSKDDIKIIREACDGARGIAVTDGYKKWLGPLQFLKRKISVDEVANRLVSMDKNKTSRLGRAFSTFLQTCHRGFTFGGSKATVLFFVTPFLVDTIIDVKKAEPKEKAGTAAHGLVHSMSWVFTFPLALKIMHHLGGAQYAGMSADKVAEYRNLIKEFNKKVKNGAFDSYDKYLNGEGGLKELKTKLNALKVNKGQNLLTKISKKLGSFLTMDLENVASYQGKNKIMNLVRKIPCFFRNLGGVPMRLALWGGISMGLLDTIINKCIKGCFGNYYDRFKEEEQVAAKEQQKEFTKEDLQARLLEAQRQKVLGATPIQETNNIVKPELDMNLVQDNSLDTVSETDQELKQEVNTTYENKIKDEIEQKNNFYKKNEQGKENKTTEFVEQAKPVENIQELQQVNKDNAKIESIAPATILTEKTSDKHSIANNYTQNNIAVENSAENYNRKLRDNYTYVPSSENVIKEEKPKNETNKYIPSQMGANFTKTFDNSGFDAVMEKADRAEKKALEILAGNFNGI